MRTLKPQNINHEQGIKKIPEPSKVFCHFLGDRDGLMGSVAFLWPGLIVISIN